MDTEDDTDPTVGPWPALSFEIDAAIVLADCPSFCNPVAFALRRLADSLDRGAPTKADADMLARGHTLRIEMLGD